MNFKLNRMSIWRIILLTTVGIILFLSLSPLALEFFTVFQEKKYDQARERQKRKEVNQIIAESRTDLLREMVEGTPSKTLEESSPKTVGRIEEVLTLTAATQEDRDGTFNGEKPIFHAIKQDDLGAVKALLDHGADVNSLDKNGLTPVLFSVKENKRDILRLLLERKANPNIQDKFGNSPLKIALELDHALIIRLLLEFRADPYLKNKLGLCAFDYAKCYELINEYYSSARVLEKNEIKFENKKRIVSAAIQEVQSKNLPQALFYFQCAASENIEMDAKTYYSWAKVAAESKNKGISIQALQKAVQLDPGIKKLVVKEKSFENFLGSYFEYIRSGPDFSDQAIVKILRSNMWTSACADIESYFEGDRYVSESPPELLQFRMNGEVGHTTCDGTKKILAKSYRVINRQVIAKKPDGKTITFQFKFKATSNSGAHLLEVDSSKASSGNIWNESDHLDQIP